jgi:hypothetical protein
MGDETAALQSVSDLPVQDPPGEEFSAADLWWAKYASSEHHCEDVALIPYERLGAFISGECNNPEYPTRFHIERSRKRKRGDLKEFRSDEYLKYRLYAPLSLPPATTSPAPLAILLPDTYADHVKSLAITSSK